MPSVRRALALSFAGKYSSLAIHTVAVMVLARLLTPAEIGVYSVAAAVVGLAEQYGASTSVRFCGKMLEYPIKVEQTN